MQVKLAAALARFSQGERLDVTATCAELGISRPTFYKYAARFQAEGIEGLLPRSRRPRSSPARTLPQVEEVIVRWRKELTDQGLDAGAVSIGYRMARAGQPAPSTATIHRVLVRHGLVTPAPAKRPRSSWRSFTYPRGNDCWQTDATEVVLAGGRKAVVFHLLDDCSRLSLASLAAPAETGEGAWACLNAAMTRHGIPAMVLSDNGSAFSAKLRGGEAAFERSLRLLGVNVVTSSPYHPQTCGKTERFHQTFKKWLTAQVARCGPPATLADLQALADTFEALYNSQRPHASLAGRTPAEVYAATERAPQPTTPRQAATRTATITVSTRGSVFIGGAGRYEAHIGRRYEGVTVTVITTGDHVSIFHGKRLIRSLTIDPTRRYQPLGTSPGGRRQARLLSTNS